jgi:hypothetical protein
VALPACHQEIGITLLVLSFFFSVFAASVCIPRSASGHR